MAAANTAASEKPKKADEVKLVKLRLPLENVPGSNQTEFCSVNGKNYLIKRGETVEVPEAVKRLFDEIEERKEKAFRYATSEKALRDPAK